MTVEAKCDAIAIGSAHTGRMMGRSAEQVRVPGAKRVNAMIAGLGHSISLRPGQLVIQANAPQEYVYHRLMS